MDESDQPRTVRVRLAPLEHPYRVLRRALPPTQRRLGVRAVRMTAATIVPVRSDILDVAVCPGCRFRPLNREVFSADDHGEPLDGVVWCPQCRRWYPLEDGLLEFLVEPLGYAEDRDRFRTAHDTELRAAGLDPGGQVASIARSDEILHQQEHFELVRRQHRSDVRHIRAAAVLAGARRDHLRALEAADQARHAPARRRLRSGPQHVQVPRPGDRRSWRSTSPSAWSVRRSTAPGPQRPRDVHHRRHDVYCRSSTSSFDYVLTYGVLHHVPDPSASVSRDRPAAAPGGHVLRFREQPLRVARGLRASAAPAAAVARGGGRVRPDLAAADVRLARGRRACWCRCARASSCRRTRSTASSSRQANVCSNGPTGWATRSPACAGTAGWSSPRASSTPTLVSAIERPYAVAARLPPLPSARSPRRPEVYWLSATFALAFGLRLVFSLAVSRIQLVWDAAAYWARDAEDPGVGLRRIAAIATPVDTPGGGLAHARSKP